MYTHRPANICFSEGVEGRLSGSVVASVAQLDYYFLIAAVQTIRTRTDYAKRRTCITVETLLLGRLFVLDPNRVNFTVLLLLLQLLARLAGAPDLAQALLPACSQALRAFLPSATCCPPIFAKV